MLFNSALFLVFFPIVTFLYFAVKHKYRWFVLLAASSYFYMCFVPVYIFILAFTIIIDYFAGILIERSEGRRRKLFLILSIVANVGVLFIFKYFDFFNSFFADVAGWMSVSYPVHNLSILLPIGLSFHTFQSLSYTIEVYRGKHPAERHLGIFALYVMFYPQLVAGPIERPQHMLHQFREEKKFDLEQLGSGLRLMAWGFFMKVVIADRLAFFVNEVYSGVQYFQGPSLVTATAMFSFQIYCDFAGYSLIAIGSARTMGFTLMQNFNRPYIARSIADFWRRWHISLSSWFKDYVYIPLGGNRVGRWKLSRNVIVTFLLSGLWHGANWTYLVWGALNGCYLVVASFTVEWRSQFVQYLDYIRWPRLHLVWQVGCTFILTSFAWIFFRANTLADAKYVVSHLLVGWGEFIMNFTNLAYWQRNIFFGQQPVEFVLAVLSIIFLLVAEWWFDKRKAASQPVVNVWWRPFAFATLLFMIFLLGEFKAQQFIYFQF